jgi:CheY-like chemotaxis protein
MIIQPGTHPAARAVPATRVLVADDEPVNRLLIAELLQEHGLICEEAEDGPGALKRLRAERYDLVFLDLSMPGMDGPGVCRRLRADPATHSLYLVAYTAHAFGRHLRELIEHGFDAVLTKPVSAQQLSRILDEHRSAGGRSQRRAPGPRNTGTTDA